MDYSYENDPELEESARRMSLAAVEVARDNFDVDLDFTPASVRRVEEVLSRLYELKERDRPDEERVWLFAQLFGSYVGEVIRREHGGGWCMLEAEGERFPGLLFGPAPTAIWPWSRVHKRLVEGSEENVWHYFLLVTDGDARTPTATGCA